MDYYYIEKKLQEWNQIELFLRERYFAKLKNSKNNDFKYILDADEIKINQFLLEGNYISSNIHKMYESNIFTLTNNHMDIAFCRHNRYNPVFLHGHSFYEIIYILKGHAHNSINGEKILLTTGDILIIPVGVKHEIAVFNDDTILMNIVIRNSTFKDVFFDFLNQDNILSKFFLMNLYMKNTSNYILFHTGENRDILNTFYEMYSEFVEKKPYSNIVIPNLLKVFFARILRYYDKMAEISSSNSEEEMVAVAFLQYIKEHYQNITLEDIAKHFHFTEPYTSKLIKKATGKTFSQLLQRIRMDNAILLLKNTDISISAVGESIGYMNPENFIRLFKKYYDISPGEYRNKIKKNL